jgi:hypothetical protein
LNSPEENLSLSIGNLKVIKIFPLPLSSSSCLWIIWVLFQKSIKWITFRTRERKSFIYIVGREFSTGVFTWKRKILMKEESQ